MGLSCLSRILGCTLLLVAFSASVAPASGKSVKGSQANHPVVHMGVDYLFAHDIGARGAFSDTQIQSLGFSVGVYHRFTRFDLGLLVGHHGMGTFGGTNGRRFFASGQTFANFDVRWRYLRKRWGDFSLNLGFGFTGFSQTDEAIAQSESTGFGEGSVPKFGVGTNIQASIGVLIHMTEHLSSHLKLGISSAFLMEDDQQEVPERLHVLNILVSYGIEFIP